MFKQWILQKIKKRKMPYKVNKSAEEWKAKLSPEQYRVLREHGTERPFTGE
jgi:peptide-methionine (R)-S-oxide reductase